MQRQNAREYTQYSLRFFLASAKNLSSLKTFPLRWFPRQAGEMSAEQTKGGRFTASEKVSAQQTDEV